MCFRMEFSFKNKSIFSSLLIVSVEQALISLLKQEQHWIALPSQVNNWGSCPGFRPGEGPEDPLKHGTW